MQTTLFDIDQVDPVEVVSEAHRIARQNAYDNWNAAFLKRDYARKAPEILASGDPARIRLYGQWQVRVWEAKQLRERGAA